MIHKWKTTGALVKHFSFSIPGGPSGEAATLFNKMYDDIPDFKKYTPVMAAASYLIAYMVAFSDMQLATHLNRVLPTLVSQGHLNTFQIEVLTEYANTLQAQLDYLGD